MDAADNTALSDRILMADEDRIKFVDETDRALEAATNDDEERFTFFGRKRKKKLRKDHEEEPTPTPIPEANSTAKPTLVPTRESIINGIVSD
ncbi:unnamed protein product [Phytophthora fragariaefolia]|uniref:Unnamed protein product n=1 Tax=Phytophthora fragariaefolia TaxID=1490495 RepID=A0A9W6Y824_9STRA|nr:unnamed protein product [Phytophthora fragariaefolia]